MSPRILQIDIETAPHTAMVWGPKQTYISPDNIVQNGYTMCFAAKWYGKPGVEFYSVHHDGNEKMVQAAWELLDQADAVIHYNGTKFDIPTLNGDFQEAGLGVPSSYHEIDLLKTVRRKFRKYSNKLDEIAKWLGVGHKVHHKGLALWLECMDGDEKAWATMRRYNIMDVKLLERVYNKLLPWIQHHPNHALYVSAEKPCCPKCGSDKLQNRGYEMTRTQRYQRVKCTKCGSWSRKRTTAVPADERGNILVAM